MFPPVFRRCTVGLKQIIFQSCLDELMIKKRILPKLENNSLESFEKVDLKL